MIIQTVKKSMSIVPFLIATVQATQLSCPVEAQGERRKFDFTLDLQNNSGEVIYQYLDKVQFQTSNELTITPNYIVFPIYSGATIDRRDLTISFGAYDGVCEIVKPQEVQRKI